MDWGVNVLSSSFGCQSKLQTLWLINSAIKSLPSSFKNLTRLQFLILESSIKLHTLSELPPALEILDATGCTSLKTVLFPSIAEQFKENRKEVSFWNCLKLDDHSLEAIGLNAHINVMKFAYQNLSAPDETFYDPYRRHEFYQAKYVYPGSRLPKWLEYKTIKDYMVIDMSSIQSSPLLGFIFSFVISGPKMETTILHRFAFYIIVSDVENKSVKETFDIFMSDSVFWIKGDHVCVIYDHRCSHYINSRAQNQTRFKIKVEAMLVEKHHRLGIEVKGFGVSPLNTSTYHNFIQQVNTSTDHSLIHQIKISANHRFIQQMEIPGAMYFIQMLPMIIFASFLIKRRRL